MDMFNYQNCAFCLIWCGKKILLSERKKKGRFQGFFAAVGGKIDTGEDITQGLCREIYEETGAYIYNGSMKIIDCYILPEVKQKAFVFESFQNPTFYHNVSNVEPHKHGEWKLYSIQEALNLKLMPYLRDYLQNMDEDRIVSHY